MKPRVAFALKVTVGLMGLSVVVSVLTPDRLARDRTKAEKQWRRLMEGPHLKRVGIPAIKVQRFTPASAQDSAQIKKQIANLANIDRPDFGISATMSATAFAPVAGSQKHGGGFLLADHQIKTTEDSKQLVALGPRALPFLLEALDDKTPTKLTQTQSGIVEGVFLSAEMGSNPANSVEQKAVSTLPKSDDGLGRGTISDYTVKVGDVCFAIIGQIVGRNYLAVRYQPSAIIVINSPVEEKGLAKAVRDIWSGNNAAQRLLDSLLFDYATEGSDLQAGAAMRMVYYFPKETLGMIAERLARLDVDGVRTEEFIKAVAWSEEPSIRRELLNIFKRTTDTSVLLAALPAIDAGESGLVRSRLNEMIDRLPADEPYGQDYSLLVALGEKFGQQAKPTFVRFLQNASLQRWRSMARVLRETRSEWAAELLSPALGDKREFGWTYALAPGQGEPRRQIRVCDEAAETISLSRPDLAFKMAGEHEDLDRQIATIRARLMGAQP